MKSYYAKVLPYYKDIITDKSDNEDAEVDVSKQHEGAQEDMVEQDIEHVYVDIPSADPYTETEAPVHEEHSMVMEEDTIYIYICRMDTRNSRSNSRCNIYSNIY